LLHGHTHQINWPNLLRLNLINQSVNPSVRHSISSQVKHQPHSAPNEIIQFALAFGLIMIIIIITTTVIINTPTLAGLINWDKVLVLAKEIFPVQM